MDMLFRVLTICLAMVTGFKVYSPQAESLPGVTYSDTLTHLFVTLLKPGFLHSMRHGTSYPVYKYISFGNWVQKQAAYCVISLNGHAYHE